MHKPTSPPIVPQASIMNVQSCSVLNRVLSSRPEIVFIDRGVEDYEVLAQGVRPGVEVHLLGADAIAQMTSVLSNRQGLEAVHLVSHGSPGCLYVGEAELSLSTLGQYADQLRSWFENDAKGQKPALMLYANGVRFSFKLPSQRLEWPCWARITTQESATTPLKLLQRASTKVVSKKSG